MALRRSAFSALRAALDAASASSSSRVGPVWVQGSCTLRRTPPASGIQGFRVAKTNSLLAGLGMLTEPTLLRVQWDVHLLYPQV